MSNKLHVPENLEQDQHATNIIKEAISEVLTQCQSVIKEDVSFVYTEVFHSKCSCQLTDQNQYWWEVANIWPCIESHSWDMLHCNSGLCAQLALLVSNMTYTHGYEAHILKAKGVSRETKLHGPKYWDEVDKFLQLVHQMANSDGCKVTWWVIWYHAIVLLTSEVQ